MKHRVSIIAMLTALSWAGPSIAQPVAQPDAFARLGIARIKLADEGKIFLNGTRDPAAGYTTPEKWVANIELGYFVLDTVAIQFAGTTPATTPNKRSEEHTSELQSLMRISYAGFCLKKTNKKNTNN